MAGKRRSATKNGEVGLQEQPEPPFPKQHQPKPGIESRLEPRPEYPSYITGEVLTLLGGETTAA